MTTDGEFSDSAEALVAVLREAGEHFWSGQIEEIKQGVVNAESKAERRRWLGHVFALYSGMGGLTDLVLQRNGKVLPSQATMANLRQQVFSSAVDLLEV